ncbi:MAG: PspC domain-containing protein [Gammaproteobacteria bacterium]|nr:PspC domain-containing protein [Gammaproteobacteria bacterium]
MSKDKRDAERVARRAKRLAERAEERARRKERQAERAAERAARLAQRANRRPGRDTELDKSIADLVDEVTQKAELWIDDQTRGMFDSRDEEREIKRVASEAEKARKQAENARQSADQAGRAAEELSQYEESLGVDSDFEDLFEDVERPRRRTRGGARKARRKARAQRNSQGFTWVYDSWPRSRSRARRRKSAHLYRDRQRKKICGVCAGVADYVGRPAWEIRLYAVLGLIFIPSVMFPSYFIAYFLMEDKPYYRRVTDRFKEGRDDRSSEYDPKDWDKRNRAESREDHVANDLSEKEPVMSNVQAMKTAKDKFSNIEQRLRQMEGHVTSSRFELQREFRKISGED